MNSFEIITDFIKSGQLLSFKGNISSDTVVLINNINEVFQFSEPWTDLREQEESLLINFKNFRKDFDIVSKFVFAYLPIKFHDFIDDINTDLEICFIALNHPETKSVLTESLWNSYLNGGFPCGWKGDYPQGQLIVFWDEERKTREPEENAHIKRVLYEQRKLRQSL